MNRPLVTNMDDRYGSPEVFGGGQMNHLLVTNMIIVLVNPQLTDTRRHCRDYRNRRT